jgi:hypothetical protein
MSTHCDGCGTELFERVEIKARLPRTDSFSGTQTSSTAPSKACLRKSEHRRRRLHEARTA